MTCTKKLEQRINEASPRRFIFLLMRNRERRDKVVCACRYACLFECVSVSVSVSVGVSVVVVCV